MKLNAVSGISDLPVSFTTSNCFLETSLENAMPIFFLSNSIIVAEFFWEKYILSVIFEQDVGWCRKRWALGNVDL